MMMVALVTSFRLIIHTFTLLIAHYSFDKIFSFVLYCLFDVFRFLYINNFFKNFNMNRLTQYLECLLMR